MGNTCGCGFDEVAVSKPLAGEELPLRPTLRHATTSAQRSTRERSAPVAGPQHSDFRKVERLEGGHGRVPIPLGAHPIRLANYLSQPGDTWISQS
jgi:hypothetical protein